MVNELVEATAELFKALSSASRLRVLLQLTRGPMDVSTLAQRTELSQPLASQHLRTLRLSGLVNVTRTGRNSVYSIRDEHVAHIVRDAVAHIEEAL